MKSCGIRCSWRFTIVMRRSGLAHGESGEGYGDLTQQQRQRVVELVRC